ncbi:uncharacterized protein Dsimw501_GD28060, isoform B [Drosophila simulans]|uniref:Uncharacterized protein, isoform B n=1 Tax=Drosophila simulans TaxID=7240 RepID=A0A0J9RP03_DROSI|nr:uncharacterized protein Dsimw501_GD28060, isoform B [Drosophila simulans]
MLTTSNAYAGSQLRIWIRIQRVRELAVQHDECPIPAPRFLLSTYKWSLSPGNRDSDTYAISIGRVPAGRVVTVGILAQDFCAPQNQLKCQAA